MLGREGVVPVKVPRPEAFAWHKLLVSQLRTTTREKATKDVAQAAVLLASLAEDAPDVLADAFAALPRGTKAKTRSAMRRVFAALSLGPLRFHPRATFNHIGQWTTKVEGILTARGGARAREAARGDHFARLS